MPSVFCPLSIQCSSSPCLPTSAAATSPSVHVFISLSYVTSFSHQHSDLVSIFPNTVQSM